MRNFFKKYTICYMCFSMVLIILNIYKENDALITLFERLITQKSTDCIQYTDSAAQV